MVITRYIGRSTDFRGKTLWEIVGNLKNFGIGRIVVRSMFERYPEPSFMKILAVEPQLNEDPRKVKVVVEKTFRGRKIPRPIEILSTSYKTDYRLLHLDEVDNYCKITEPFVDKRKLPTQLEFPPLLKQYVLRDYSKKGIKVPENLTLEVKYAKSINNTYEADTRNTKILPIGLGTEESKLLYSEQKSV